MEHKIIGGAAFDSLEAIYRLSDDIEETVAFKDSTGRLFVTYKDEAVHEWRWLFVGTYWLASRAAHPSPVAPFARVSAEITITV